MFRRLTSFFRQIYDKPKSTQIALVRKFRWILEGNNIPYQFVKSVNIDWANKSVYVDIIEVESPSVWDWFWSNYANGDYCFTTYNSRGEEIYRHTFKDCVVSPFGLQKFDYANSSESVLNLRIDFTHYETETYENQYDV